MPPENQRRSSSCTRTKSMIFLLDALGSSRFSAKSDGLLGQINSVPLLKNNDRAQTNDGCLMQRILFKSVFCVDSEC